MSSTLIGVWGTSLGASVCGASGMLGLVSDTVHSARAGLYRIFQVIFGEGTCSTSLAYVLTIEVSSFSVSVTCISALG